MCRQIRGGKDSQLKIWPRMAWSRASHPRAWVHPERSILDLVRRPRIGRVRCLQANQAGRPSDRGPRAATAGNWPWPSAFLPAPTIVRWRGQQGCPACRWPAAMAVLGGQKAFLGAGQLPCSVVHREATFRPHSIHNSQGCNVEPARCHGQGSGPPEVGRVGTAQLKV